VLPAQSASYSLHDQFFLSGTVTAIRKSVALFVTKSAPIWQNCRWENGRFAGGFSCKYIVYKELDVVMAASEGRGERRRGCLPAPNQPAARGYSGISQTL